MRLPRCVWTLWTQSEKVLPDGLSLRLAYRRKTGRVLHLRHPKAFGEKIQWMKLNYRPAIYPVLADKFTVRRFVAERVGTAVMPELHGVWVRAEEVPFDDLPDRYALKVTSASHANLFCTSKGGLDPVVARAKLADWMGRNHYLGSREWAYKDCRPRIICEEFLDDGTGGAPTDYKFFCFDGKPAFIEASIGRTRNLTLTILDLQWNRLPFGYAKYPSHPTDIPRPATLAEMIDIAGRLSAGFPFMRVDFYCIAGRTVFGEITWYPSSGLMPFHPFEHELKVGEMLRLPKGV